MPSEKEQSAESSFASFTTQAETADEEEEEYDETYQLVDPEDRNDSSLYGTLDEASFSRPQKLIVFLSIFISAVCPLSVLSSPLLDPKGLTKDNVVCGM